MSLNQYLESLKNDLKSLKMKGQYKEAHQLLDEYNHTTKDELVDLYCEKIYLYRYEDDLDNAILYSEKLLILYPNNINYLFLYSLNLVESLHFHKAVKSLSKLIENSILNNNSYFLESSYALRAWCYIHLNDYHNANQDLVYLSDDFILYLKDGVSITKVYMINLFY